MLSGAIDTRLLPDGPHTLRIDARDRVGNAATSFIAFSTDNTRPSLRVQSPQTVLAGRAFRATALVADGGSGLAAPPAWLLGDGSTAMRAQVVHRYRRPGRYTLRVSASDRAGNTATAARRVRVVALLIHPASGARPSVIVQLAHPGAIRVEVGGRVARTATLGRAPRRIRLSGLARGTHRVTIIAGAARATRLVRAT